LEEAREKKIQQSAEVKERFIIEVDKAVEDRSQLAADRRYHQLQADLAFPGWLKKYVIQSATIRFFLSNKGLNTFIL
jgi:hypothetical protein